MREFSGNKPINLLGVSTPSEIHLDNVLISNTKTVLKFIIFDAFF